jgi:hypothetical protein
MRKSLLSATVFLAATFSLGQAINPQNTFANAVNSDGPSLWLNFNDATASFKDSLSGLSTIKTQTIQSTTSAGSNCHYGVPTASSLTCYVAATVTDAIIVVVYPGTSTITSLTDSYGASPVLVATGTYTSVYYFANVAAGSHGITAALSGAVANAYPMIQAFDVAGAATSSPVDAYSYKSQTTATTAITSGSLTTTVAGDMLIGSTQGGGAGGTYSAGSPAFTLVAGSYASQEGGYYPATTVGSYAFTANSNVSLPWSTWIIAVKPKTATYTSGVISLQQPGFDNTNNANYSAAFPYNGWAAAPNVTVGSTMEWNTPWTMLLHINKLNWDHTGGLVLASKGDLNTVGVINNWWELSLQQNSGNAMASQLCFARTGTAPYTSLVGPAFAAGQQWCSPIIVDAMPNSFNYDIVVEDNGSGSINSLSMWINGLAQPLLKTAYSPNGFGGVTIAVANGGSGYTSAPAVASTGGGANCTVTGTVANVTSGAVSSVSTNSSGCTSAPSITVTGGGGSGAVLTATSYPMRMNSPTQPLMVPGYVNNGVYYGPGGADSSENPLYVDEFVEFPGNLTPSQITNLFYETKFYQGFIYPGLTANPPLVIFEGYGCGPDFSGDQTIAMVIGAHKAGLIRLIGFNDDDSAATGSNSAPMWRQMLDQAGLADVPLSIGANSTQPNLSGCPAANITAYNADTPQNPASYESALTMYRTLFAKYPTTPIYVLMTQAANGYNSFQLSPADSISPLTGLQLQAQNYANGGWVNAFEGNFYTTPTNYLSVLNNVGALPIYFEGGQPAPGGPGVYVSRTANDPLYMAAREMAGGTNDAVSGWTNQNLAQVISPYFLGGVQIALSGGTGYAANTPFTSVGGGPYCHVAGVMVSVSGVPSSVMTPWYTSATSSYNGLGYGCTPAVFTATASGTNLTVSAVTLGTITSGDTISGTGIPTGTTIVSQTSGTAGGVGVYVTSASTTASAATVTRQPTIVLTAPAGTGVTMSASMGIFIKSYEGSATASYAVWPNMWGMSQVFTWFQNSLIDPPTTGTPRSN